MNRYNQRIEFAPGSAESFKELREYLSEMRKDAEYENRLYIITQLLEEQAGLYKFMDGNFQRLIFRDLLENSYEEYHRKAKALKDEEERKIIDRTKRLTDSDKKSFFEQLKNIIYSTKYEEGFFHNIDGIVPIEPPTYSKLSEEKKKILLRFIKEIRDAALPPFKDVLIQFMNEKNISSRDLFMRANIDRHFLSKILCNEGYIPKKKNIMAIAMALHLSLPEYDDFMLSAGYVTDPYDNTDLAVRFCIIQGGYDPIYYEIDTLNSFLAELKEECFEFKRRKKPFISRRKCNGCGLCAKNFPDIFEIKYGKSSVKSSFSGNIAAIEKAAEECPSNAMEIR